MPSQPPEMNGEACSVCQKPLGDIRGAYIRLSPLQR